MLFFWVPFQCISSALQFAIHFPDKYADFYVPSRFFTLSQNSERSQIVQFFSTNITVLVHLVDIFILFSHKLF